MAKRAETVMTWRHGDVIVIGGVELARFRDHNRREKVRVKHPATKVPRMKRRRRKR